MGQKAEIAWQRRTEDGQKLQVYAHHVGKDWRFYHRERRFDEWQPLEHPPLVDWMELLDAVERRVNRRQLRPEEPARVRKRIKELFPEADL